MSHDPPLPPPLASAPAQDTARYVEWMKAHHKPITDTATEAVNLRIGPWGFFSHGAGPGQSLDRTGLDRSQHAIVRGEGAWYEFLTTQGLDAQGAFDRVAWLYAAIPIAPGPRYPQAKPPTLTTKDGRVTLQGDIAFPPETSRVMRMTITADPHGAKIASEPLTK